MNYADDQVATLDTALASAGRLLTELRADEAELRASAVVDENVLAEGKAALQRAVEATQRLIDVLERS